MNLKLRRLVRTSASEQYALFDLDQTDADYHPMSIGKLDLHFADEGVYGTFLLWNSAISKLPPGQVRQLVEATIEDLCEPVGIPAFYAIEYLVADLGTYLLLSSEEDHGEDPA